jgi:hypothetical protein
MVKESITEAFKPESSIGLVTCRFRRHDRITIKTMSKKQSKSKTESSLFIGGGFMDSQLIYILPFSIGYAKRRGIKTLILEKELPHLVAENKTIKGILAEFTIIYIRKKGSRLNTLIGKITNRLGATRVSGLLNAIKINRSQLLAEKNWGKSQILHAAWDTAFKENLDGAIDIPLISRLTATNAVQSNVNLARILVKRYSVSAAIMGHMVYTARALTYELKNLGISVIAQAAYVLYLVPDNKDTRWSFISASLYAFILSKQQNIMTIANEYWDARTRGESSYHDSNQAIIQRKNIKNGTPPNIVFLHVFRDSPFNYIDQSRIFADFSDWVLYTLKAIADSNEEWLIRCHPSATSWGECQQTWLDSFCKRLFGGKWPTNIAVDSDYSNISVLQNGKRVLTYQGTVHLEAASLGIKPIVITDVTLNMFDPEFAHKPKSREDYSRLIKMPAIAQDFQLSQEAINTARILLYIREKVLSFREDTGAYTVRRLDGNAAFIEELRSVEKMSCYFSEKMVRLGESMANGLEHSISLKYAEDWYAYNNAT